MNETTRETTAPVHENGIVLGHVSQIDDETKEHFFPTRKDELELLAEHWADYSKSIWDGREYYRIYGARDARNKIYAWDRLNKIREILGDDCVSKIIENVQTERFGSDYFGPDGKLEACLHGEQPCLNTLTFYTRGRRCIVRHHSRVGSRPFLADEAVQPEGWWWQTAQEFKQLDPIEHFGFPNAAVALQSAQAWEDSFFSQLFIQLENFEPDVDQNEYESKRNAAIARTIEELRKLLSVHIVKGTYWLCSDNQDLCGKASGKDRWPRGRIEVQLDDPGASKPSGRMFITWGTGDWNPSSIVGTPLARQHYEAVVRAIVALQQPDCTEPRHDFRGITQILAAVGFEYLTKKGERQSSRS